MSLDITLLETKPTPVYNSNITHNLVPVAKLLGVYELLWGDTYKRAGDMIPPQKCVLLMKVNENVSDR